MVRRLLLCLLALSSVCWAQPVLVTAELNPRSIGIGDRAVLTVNVEGPGSVSIQTPYAEKASITRGGQTSKTSWINGSMSSSQSFHFHVFPTDTGTLTLGPLTVEVDGVPYQTEALNLEVVAQGTNPASTRPNPYHRRTLSFDPWDSNPVKEPVKIRTTVSANSIYQHQPVLYTLTFLNSVRMRGDTRYDAINPPGFLKLEMPQEASGEEYVDGVAYGKTEISTAFFPLSPGEVELPSTMVRAYPLFLIGPKTLYTEAHHLEVKPLPTRGRPEGFGGAVGQFTFDAHLDNWRGRVGDPIKLVCSIEGNGHADLITDFPLPKLPGFRVYQTQSEGKTWAEDGQVRCSKEFSTVIIPESAGEKVISGIRFVYFDPEKEAFEVLKADDMKIRVLPGSPGSEPSAAATASEDEAQEEVLVPAEEPRPGASLYFRSRGFQGLQLLPLLAWLALVAVPWTVTRWKQRPRKEPRRNFKRELGQAQSYSELSRTARTAVDKLLGGSGWRLKELPEELAQKGFSEAQGRELAQLLEELDRASFSPAGQGPDLAALREKLLPLLQNLREAGSP